MGQIRRFHEIPYFVHFLTKNLRTALKTLAFEIAEQLNWSSPDNIICPCGNGGIYLGLYIGFKELMEAGIIDKMPKLLGVQSDKCPPLYLAYKEGKESSRSD